MKTKAQISYNMSRIRNKGSLMERRFASGLRKRRIKFRFHAKNIIGHPDFIFLKKKIAVFCDSHFWHGYNWAVRKYDHKTNKKFWITKIERNMARDKKVNKALKREGWCVLRFWEHQITSNLDECIRKIQGIHARKISQ